MASRASYSPISRQSISADDDTSTQTLLSHDESEKPFSFERPHRTLFQRRHSLACKSMLFLLVLAIHASLVILLAGWLAPKLQGSPTSSSTKATGLAGHDMDMEIHTGGDGNGDAYTPHFAQHNEHNDNDNDNAAAALAVSCIVPDLDREYTFEGIHPAVYKDPTAEFLMKDPCGSTPTEARARGCRYGMLYGSWLPDECWDEETEVNFKKVKDWRFWLQANRTEELSWEEVARGEHEYVLVEWECKCVFFMSVRFFKFSPLPSRFLFSPLSLVVTTGYAQRLMILLPQITNATAPR